MQGLQAHDWGAGQVLKGYAARLYDAGLGKPEIEAVDLSRPLALYRTRIPTDWVDYNGHMNESRYLQLFSDACDALLRLIGLDQNYLARGFSWFTVETHIMHKDEAHAGDPVAVTIQMLGADEKRMHIFQTATRESDGVVVATGEQMLLHVDTKAGRACSAEGEMRSRVLRVAAAQADWRVPPMPAGMLASGKRDERPRPDAAADCRQCGREPLRRGRGAARACWTSPRRPPPLLVSAKRGRIRLRADPTACRVGRRGASVARSPGSVLPQGLDGRVHEYW